MERQKNILVIGDTILDIYIYISPNKISDEAHVITSLIENIKYVLGGGSNVARNIASLGHKCTYIGISTKELQNKIKSEFKFYGVNPKLYCASDSVQVKTRIISTRGSQICRYDSKIDPMISKEIKSNIISYINDNIKDFDFVIMSKYYDFFMDESFCQKIISICNKNNKKVLVDNRQNNAKWFKNIDFYKFNFNEFNNLFPFEKIKNDEKSIICCIEKNIDFFSMFKNLIITRSNYPTIYYNTLDRKWISVDVDEVVVKDVSGAGDTFVASFATQFSDSIDIKNIIKKSHDICNVVVKKLGTDVVWTYELNLLTDISLISKHLKINGKKIVLTNGVFDILHEGHMKILKEAKKHGDYLIVAINSDASVKKLKGSDRPIKSEDERKKILELIKYVDKVIIFNEQTVDKLIKKIKPNIYVKGGDYNLDNIPEKNSLKYVEDVVFVKMIKNKSSTDLIKKIRG